MSMIGKTLGHYEITSQLGKGGMGEVYQANDRKLGRDVAIKVLPEEFARDAERLSRFQREAKLLASLNHSNIAAIYGLEESGGTNFLVLELVEGETLADRIKAGPIAVEESLKLALQIAEALEAAHDRGVIHRDLKPANIKVTPEGKVKVLDFGLAKVFAGDRADINLSNSPTLTGSPTLSDMATMQGVILGTAAYMSPEQARGKSVDKKADVWAFGCVLFEMITGRVAFSGKDVTDILAAVIRSEPEWTTLPANLHGRLREVLERCMKKDAKDRYHDISDVKADIQRVLTDSSGVLVQPVMAAEPRRKLRTIFPWVAAALILGAIIAGVAVWKLKPSEPRQVMRSEYSLPEGQQLNNTSALTLAVSPDGRRFAYVTAKGLYLRSVDEFDAKPIIGTETSPSYPIFSPDGKWIGYFSSADRKLKKIAISGGAPVTICDVSLLMATSWGADDRIVFAEYLEGIKRVSANGGTPELIVKGAAYHPQLLPDGKSLLFSFGDAPYKTIVQSLQSGERKELFAGDNARYLSTGHIVYGLGNNLFAVPFDFKTLKVTGGPVSVVEGIWRAASDVAPQYAVSDAGTLIYIPGQTSAVAGVQRTLAWVDGRGKEEPISAVPNDYRMPIISPDGTRVALTIYIGQKSDIWIWDLTRETMTRLTFNETSASPLWTLDGQRIAFVSGLNRSAVYWKAANGAGEDEKLGSAPDRSLSPCSWSSDGKTLVVLEFPGGYNWDIGSLSMEGDHKWRSLLHEKYIELQPNISPNGRWMAYMSTESGRNEVYVRPFPEINKGRWQVSTSGGNSPLWSPDGRELFYRSGDAVMAVPVETEPAFRPGKPEALFRGAYVGLSTIDAHTWDISPDGKRFLMIKEAVSAANPATPEGPRKINIVVNWFEELKQRAPVK
jgi:eukaryotic-like serine/threonine-protein kinase